MANEATQMTASQIISNTISKVSRAALPAPMIGMSGAEAGAYQEQANVSRNQAKELEAARSDLEAVSADQIAAYDHFFSGMAAQAEAEQAKFQLEADNQAAANKLYSVGVDPDSLTAQLATYQTQNLAPQIIQRAQQIEYLVNEQGNDPLGGLGYDRAINGLVGEHNTLVDVTNSLEGVIDNAITSSANLATRVNAAIPKVTRAELAGKLQQQEGEAKLKKAAVTEQQIKDDVLLLNQQTDAIIRASGAIINRAQTQRQIDITNINTQQEAARFALQKETTLAELQLKRREAKTKEQAESTLIGLVNQGLKMEGVGYRFSSIEDLDMFGKRNPDAVERAYNNALRGALGSSPMDALTNIVDKKGTITLGSDLGPSAKKAASVLIQANQRIGDTVKAATVGIKDKKQVQAVHAETLSKEITDAFSKENARERYGLNVPPVGSIFNAYQTNPAFSDKFPVNQKTLDAVKPLVAAKVPPSDGAVALTMVNTLQAAGFTPDQVAREVSTFFAGAATLRNSQIDGARFGFNRDPKINAAMKSYPMSVPMDDNFGRKLLIDITKPAHVKNYLLKKQTTELMGNSLFRSVDLYSR